MKILITGGHITPALAVADELKKYSDIDIIFVGRKYAQESQTEPSFEFLEIKKRGIPFINFKTGRLTRTINLSSLANLFLIPQGFITAGKILKKEKPDRVLTFGGYIAFPIGIWSYLMRIPVYIHEQTLKPGITNRVLGLFAKQIFVGFPQTAQYFNRKRTSVLGNPVRKALFESIDQESIVLPQSNKKVLYITGGSLGSHSLNVHIENILDELLNSYVIIHQCGDNSFKDYERLSLRQNDNYIVRKHFFETQIGYIFNHADIVVSRAGANTIVELIALSKPAVLVPLPISAGGEQKAQAQWLKDQGVAEIFSQNRPSKELIAKINLVAKNFDRYVANFTNLSTIFKKDAASQIAAYVHGK